MIMLTPFIMLSPRKLVQTQIAQATGTAIGNLTASGGLAASFTGANSKTWSACSSTVGLGDSWTLEPWYIGKDWGVGNTKIITGFKIYASTDRGWKENIGFNPNMKFTLLGHSSNAPASATALGNITVPNTNGSSTQILTGLNVTTAYRYHWIALKDPDNGGDQNKFMSQVQFFEDV